MVTFHSGASGLLARRNAPVELSNVGVHVREGETVLDGDHIHNQRNATHKVAQVNTFFCELFEIRQVQTTISNSEIVSRRESFMIS